MSDRSLPDLPDDSGTDPLARRMGELGSQVEPRWTPSRQEAVEKALLLESALQRRRQRFGRARLPALLAAAAVVIVALFARRLSGPSSAAGLAPGRLVLADGSAVTPDPGADVRWAEIGPTYVRATLGKGRARFEVTHTDERVFRVEAGPVAVQVLGTVFSIERVDESRSRVAVEQGRVRVFWSGASRDLGAGEQDVFPPALEPPHPLGAAPPVPGPPGPAGYLGDTPKPPGYLGDTPKPPGYLGDTPKPPGSVAEAPSVPPAAHATERPSEAGAGTWRHLAAGGAFDEAYVALKREGMQAVRDEVNDLLLAADVARLSHHPADAVDPLSRVLELHATDPRASLAAFTLGRVRLESLGQPHEAAVAFARARALDPAGELSADALAREVEARSAAGEGEAARALAERYVKEYPTGARLRSVRRYGGLE